MDLGAAVAHSPALRRLGSAPASYERVTAECEIPGWPGSVPGQCLLERVSLFHRLT